MRAFSFNAVMKHVFVVKQIDLSMAVDTTGLEVIYMWCLTIPRFVFVLRISFFDFVVLFVFCFLFFHEMPWPCVECVSLQI